MAEEENREWKNSINLKGRVSNKRAARGCGPSKFYRSDARRRRQLAGHRAQTFLSEELDVKIRKEILSATRYLTKFE